ncbi:MAG: MFS transporter [Nitrospirae bacterium]|nr:MFS transporter [Nitrospirota bacterium]
MFFNGRVPSNLRVAYYYDSFGGILYGLFFGFTIYFFTIVARTIGATDTQIALLSMAPFIAALFTFYWSHHSSRRKKMPFLVKVKGIARGLLLFMFLTVNPWLFVIFVILFWFFEMAGSPAYTGIMKDIYPTEHRGKAMGYVRVEMSLTAILATFIGGYFLNISPQSYRWVFPLGAAFGLLSLVSFRKIEVKSDRQIKADNKRFSFLKAIHIFQEDKSFFQYQLIAFLAGFGWLSTLPLYPIFVVDVLHISKAMLGTVGALFSLFWAISYLFWGKYIDKRGPLKTRYLAMLLFSFVSLFYFLASRFPEVGLWLIFMAAVFFGLGTGGGELSRFNYMTRIATEDMVQSYWGIDFTLMGIRGVLAPFVGIGLKKWLGMGGAFMLAFLLTFGGFVLMALFAKKQSQVAFKS